MSAYFPSPPESTEPPTIVESEQTEELEPEQKTELEPEPELEPELEPEPEHEPHIETEPEAEPERAPKCAPVEPMEPAALIERTASYQWPSNTGRTNNGPTLDEVCSNTWRCLL